MIISAHTDINKRSENQDIYSHLKTRYGNLFLLCDGMGGARAGHAAADYTATRLPQLLDAAAAQGQPPEEALIAAVAEVNRRIHELGSGDDPRYRGMGTTLVLALETAKGYLIGHVGDSRAYLFRKGFLLRLTGDHSHVAGLLAQGVITNEQARAHPIRNILSRAIGPHPEAPLELRAEPLVLKPGDCMLLCSDGLSGSVADEDISALLADMDDWASAAQTLVELAKQQRSSDNITVLLAHEPLAEQEQEGAGKPIFRRTDVKDSGLLITPTPDPPKSMGQWLVLTIVLIALAAIFLLRACGYTDPSEARLMPANPLEFPSGLSYDSQPGGAG